MAAYWLAATQPDRDRVEAAMFALNTAFENDPYQVGESRETDDDRFVHVPPLAVDFQIDEAAGVVRVTNVRIYR